MTYLTRKASDIRKIVLCYDDSLPASWLVGLSKLRGKLERAGVEVGGSTLLIRLRQGKAQTKDGDLRLGVDIINASVHHLPRDADIILAPVELAHKAKEAVPDAWVIPVTEFFVNPIYDEIVERLVEGAAKATDREEKTDASG